MKAFCESLLDTETIQSETLRLNAENVKNLLYLANRRVLEYLDGFCFVKSSFAFGPKYLSPRSQVAKAAESRPTFFVVFVQRFFTHVRVCRPRCQRQTGGCFGGWWALSKPWKKEPYDYWGREGVAESREDEGKQAKEQLCVVNKPCKISKEEVSTPASKE